MRITSVSILTIAAALALTAAARAQTPTGTVFTYQGQLTDAGVPLNDTADFEFTLWDAGAGGNPIGTLVSVSNVNVVDGLFTVPLDFGAAAFAGDARWLEVAVRSPSGIGGFATLSPRQPITATPYALYALSVPGGGGSTPWQLSGSDIYYNAGNVGIGTGAPEQLLHLKGLDAGVAPNANAPLVVERDRSTYINILAPDSVESGVLFGNPTNGSAAGGVVYNSIATPDGMQFRVAGNNTKMVIQSDGNVGIGETDPTAKLHIGGTPGVDGLRFPDGTLQTTAATGGAGNSWSLTGNVGTTAGVNFVGTSDNQPLELHVNGVRALRIEPNAFGPNLVGGFPGNLVDASVAAATISGGGLAGLTNRVSDHGGAIGGGVSNQAGDGAGTNDDAAYATVAGGSGNVASGLRSNIAGGRNNTASGVNSAVGGGFNNTASNSNSTIGGGANNDASGSQSTIAGGSANTASGDKSTVGGGASNTAGFLATVPGGTLNEASGAYSFAAGQRAQAADTGTFVWSDSTTSDPDFFRSTGPNQFLINAAGGVGINTNAPGAVLHIGGTPGVDGLMFPDGTIQTTAGGGGSSLWSASGSDIYYDAGNVGIGATNPTYPLTVNSPSGTAVYGYASAGTGNARGVLGEAASPDGAGVYGYNDADEGRAIGVRGMSNSPTGYGGYFEGRGYFSGNVGIGVLESSARLKVNGSANRTVQVMNTAASGTGVAVHARANSTDGVGVSGEANAGSGTTYGVRGEVFSPDGFGVSGTNGAVNGYAYGIYGETESEDGVAVYGKARNPLGVNYAVRGHTNSGDGYAGYFTGGKNYFEGKLGIGEANPAAMLHIGGEAGVDGLMFPDGTLQTTAGGGSSLWNQSGSDIFYNLGNVGIGTLSPAAELDVVGTARMDVLDLDGPPGGQGGRAQLADGAGIVTMQLFGDGGSMFLSDSAGTRTALLAAEGAGSGPSLVMALDLRNTVEILSAETPTTGAHISLSQADGRTTIELDSEVQQQGGAQMTMRDGLGRDTITLDADESPDGGGLLTLENGASLPTITLDAETGAGGARLSLLNANGHEVVTMNSVQSGGNGQLILRDSGGGTGVDLRTFDSDGGQLLLHDENGTDTMRIYAHSPLGGSDAAAIYMRNGASTTLELHANHANTGRSRLIVDVVQIEGGADLSEQFDVSSGAGPAKPGMLVSIDPLNAGKLTVCHEAHDKKVAGIVSGAGGVKPGFLMRQKGTLADGGLPVALTGRVWAYCDALNGAIQPGDLLTTSSTFGHAMKVVDHAKAQGAIIGKAMTALESGRGLVLVLVSLQ